MSNTSTTGVTLKVLNNTSNELLRDQEGYVGYNTAICACTICAQAIDPTLYQEYQTTPNTGDYALMFMNEYNAVTTHEGNDAIALYNSNNIAYVGMGSDSISSFGDNNKLYAEAGDDKLYHTGNNSIIDAGSGNDYISVKGDLNLLYGLSGNDQIILTGNQNMVSGGEGDDDIKVTGANNFIQDISGNNIIYVRGDENTITSGEGNDTITVLGNNNQLLIHGGVNSFSIAGNNNTTDVLSGNNNFSLSGNNHQLNTGAGIDTVGFNGDNSIFSLNDGNDTMNFRGNNNIVHAGNGNDKIQFNGSQYNTIHADSGDDTITVLSSSHNNMIYGGDGNDRITMMGKNNTADGGAGNDTIYGGSYTDIMVYHYGENIGAQDLYDAKGGSDILRFYFTDTELNQLATTYSYANAEQYSAALSNYFHSNLGKSLDFNQFGFNLRAISFEKLEMNVQVEQQPTISAKADSFSLTEDQSPFTLNVLANDVIQGSSVTITQINNITVTIGHIVTLASGVSVWLDNQGNLQFDTHDLFQALGNNESASITFNYTMSDQINSSSAQVSITVNGINDNPVAMNDAFQTAENSIIHGNLFANNGFGVDFDVENHAFKITEVNGVAIGAQTTITLASGAILTISDNGNFTYNTNNQFGYLNDGQSILEQFTYKVTDEQGGVSNLAQAEITIHGETIIPTMLVSDASVVEGAHGQSRFLQFHISLSNANHEGVSVNFATSNGTASAVIESDYIHKNGTIFFNPGELTKTVEIEVLGDNKFESNETLNFNLFNVMGATLVDNLGIGTIINDDVASTDPLAMPILNSNVDAKYTIFLDFNGGQTNNAWGNFYSEAYSKDSNYNAFSASELADIINVWGRVSEDFRPFDVNITTDQSVYDNTPTSQRLMAMITSSERGETAGGVAALNVMHIENYKPAWVFSDNLQNNARYIAEATSHELGHNLGLYHDGLLTSSGTLQTAYYTGHGSGHGWAPIMGVGYYQQLTQWSKGEYTNAHNKQDDLAVISSKLGYAADDHGNTLELASLLNLGVGLAAEGVIEQNTDVDVFKFTASDSFKLSVNPLAVGANLDVMATLKDATGAILAQSNPVNQLSWDLIFNTGSTEAQTFYLEVDGGGQGNPLTTGYTDYGSLGYYSVSLENLA
ncbi:MAG: VCBS domain-containing protein [Legionellales bacterium]|nr:VCBS domain-containing protein [Legionellales bacterium]